MNCRPPFSKKLRRRVSIALVLQRMAAVWCGAWTAALALSLLTAAAADPLLSGETTFDAWRRYRTLATTLPQLIRYYPLEADAVGGVKRDDAAPGADDAAALRVGISGPKPDVLELPTCEGRWAEKPAARLDREYLTASPFDVADSGFTVAAWVRVRGLGSIRGDSVPTGGTLLSMGNGYWEGWRLTLRYPQRTLGFEIGRPQPSSAVGISGGALGENTWHHVAACWDGRRMRLYLDGLPVATGEFAGPFTPPARGATFRIGYAGAGWGSLAMDVDEVQVYGRALPPAEVLRHVHFATPMPGQIALRLNAAGRALDENDLVLATAQYNALLAPETPPAYAAAARLALARLRWQSNERQQAAALFAAVMDDPAAGEGHRQAALQAMLAALPGATPYLSSRALERVLAQVDPASPDRDGLLLELPRKLRTEGQFLAARDRYAELLGQPELQPQTRLDAQLELGHVLFAAGRYAEAREALERVVAVKDAPGHYRSAAQLRIAASFVRENSPAALAAYAAVQRMDDAPAHHRWEAEELAAEFTRHREGRPARDPMRTRVVPPPLPEGALEIFVAPDGDDAAAGTAAQPLATLEGARDRVRQLRGQGELSERAVVVTLRGGEYPRTQTFTLESQDSGTAAAPVVYRAVPGEAPRLNGGTRVGPFQPVTDPAVLARLPQPARGKVVVLDLKAAGIEDYGVFGPRGYGRQPPATLELYFNHQPQPLARWPNEGFVQVVRVLETPEGGGFTFEYEGDRPAAWKDAQDVWLYGYWRHLWADNYAGVASIDPQRRTITITDAGSYRAVVAGAPYAALNLLEELDRPGEWCLDRAAGRLYFYPPAELEGALVEIPLLSSPMIEMRDAAHVRFEHLLFELGRTDGAVVNGGEACRFIGCTFRKLGGTAVQLSGGKGHGLLGCDLHTLGRGGAVVRGGQRKTLQPGEHFMVNCHVHNFSRIDRTYTPAVLLDGVANRVAHNLFRNSPGHALRVEGNDHLIEWNEVHHVVTETDDQGGLDMWFNPTYRGNVIRYNYWHHIGSGRPCGQSGVRLDDAISGTLIYGNVFYRCSEPNFGGVQIHGGKENVIDNNYFVDCHYAVSFSTWGPRRWAEFLQSERVVRETTQTVDIRVPPYSARYPELARLEEDPDVNSIWRNLVVRCGSLLHRDRGIQDIRDNLLLAEDPGFADAAGGDFTLPEGAAALDAVGLRPIPFAEIGLYPCTSRASEPPSRQERLRQAAVP